MSIQLTDVALQLIANHDAKIRTADVHNREAIRKVLAECATPATPAEMSHRIIGTYKLAGGSFMKCQLDYTRNQ